MLRFDFSAAGEYSEVCKQVNGTLSMYLAAGQLKAYQLPTLGMVGQAGESARGQLRDLNDSLYNSCLYLGAIRTDFSNMTEEAGYLKRDAETVALSVDASGVARTMWDHSTLRVDQKMTSSLATLARSILADSIARMAHALSELQGHLPNDMHAVCEPLSRQLGCQRNKLVAFARSVDTLSANVSTFELRYISGDQGSLATRLFSAFIDKAGGTVASAGLNTPDQLAKVFNEKVETATKKMALNQFVVNNDIPKTAAGSEPGMGVDKLALEEENSDLLTRALGDAKYAKYLKYLSRGCFVLAVIAGIYEIYQTGKKTYGKYSNLPERDRAALANADMLLKGVSIGAGFIAGGVAGGAIGGIVGGIPGAVVGACIGAVVGSVETERLNVILNYEFDGEGSSIRSFVRKSFVESDVDYTTGEIGGRPAIDSYGIKNW